MYCGHDGWFVADLRLVGNVCVVIAATDRVDGDMLVRDRNEEATHRMVDMPSAGVWRPHRGWFVVPRAQVTTLDGERRR